MFKAFQTLPAQKLIRAETNPRAELTALKALAASIKQHGLISPLVVAKQPDGLYLILDGHRRYDAGLTAGLSEFPCVVRDDEDQLMTALVTSAHTVKLSPLEQALAAGQMMESRHLKGAELARLLGVSPSWCSKAKKIYAAVTEDNGDRASEFTDFDKLYAWALKQSEPKIGRPKKVRAKDVTIEAMKTSGYAISASADGYKMTLAFATPAELAHSLRLAMAELDKIAASLITGENANGEDQGELAL